MDIKSRDGMSCTGHSIGPLEQFFVLKHSKMRTPNKTLMDPLDFSCSWWWIFMILLLLLLLSFFIEEKWKRAVNEFPRMTAYSIQIFKGCIIAVVVIFHCQQISKIVTLQWNKRIRRRRRICAAAVSAAAALSNRQHLTKHAFLLTVWCKIFK